MPAAFTAVPLESLSEVAHRGLIVLARDVVFAYQDNRDSTNRDGLFRPDHHLAGYRWECDPIRKPGTRAHLNLWEGSEEERRKAWTRLSGFRILVGRDAPQEAVQIHVDSGPGNVTAVEYYTPGGPDIVTRIAGDLVADAEEWQRRVERAKQKGAFRRAVQRAKPGSTP